MKFSKNQFFLLLLILLPIGYLIYSQEVFKKNKQNVIFLGSIKHDSLKVLKNSRITWISKSNLKQIGALPTKDFLPKIFAEKLQLQLEGYEPFWSARIDQKYLYFTGPESGIEKKHIIIFNYNLNKADQGVSFSFSNSTHTIFGTVNYIGFQTGENYRICEYNVSEENTLYEAYITFDGILLRECSVVIKTSELG